MSYQDIRSIQDMEIIDYEISDSNQTKNGNNGKKKPQGTI